MGMSFRALRPLENVMRCDPDILTMFSSCLLRFAEVERERARGQTLPVG